VLLIVSLSGRKKKRTARTLSERMVGQRIVLRLPPRVSFGYVFPSLVLWQEEMRDEEQQMESPRAVLVF
jgi:hypothetical protein